VVGPRGFTAPLADMDVREGGTSLVSMRSPDGHDFYNTWSYEKVVPDQRLEFVSHFADEHGTRFPGRLLGCLRGFPTGFLTSSRSPLAQMTAPS